MIKSHRRQLQSSFNLISAEIKSSALMARIGQFVQLIWIQIMKTPAKGFRADLLQLFSIFEMQVLRKLSEFSGAMPASCPPLRHKQSSYKPATRLEKIKQNRLIYPCSTEDRFVFISNMDGTGFQRQVYQNCPPSVQLEAMINAINLACYKQWEKNRQHHEKNPFCKLDCLTNISMGLLIILWLVLYSFTFQSGSAVSGELYAFLVFIIGSTVISLAVFFKKPENYNSDAEMIKAIKAKLLEFNRQEHERTNGNPEFEWTCHKECIWICLKLCPELERLDC